MGKMSAKILHYFSIKIGLDKNARGFEKIGVNPRQTRENYC